MSGYSFYSPDALELVENTKIKQIIDQYSDIHKKQTYVLCKPLTKDDSAYDYEKAIVIFISGNRPCFVDLGDSDDDIKEFAEDFLDDISFLSEKYKYREKIGRKKHWEALFDICRLGQINLDQSLLSKPSDIRIIDLLTSLVVGSINDISRINLEARDLLDLVKSKIVLFDTDQTSFVFKPSPGKRYVVQGLAGSGKTELLLHKLKELYSHDLEARIAFTCFNRILATSMKSRIPGFFDFMRVERQIDWDNKLFCFHAWGNTRDPISGMYRYICHCYGIPFGTLQSGSFDVLCKKAIAEINIVKGYEKPIFDYVFIDESQDFSESFIELCELVTAKKLFVAGDVFQNIFRPIDDRVNRSDLVLKKCYRTDPKNLMFSHALGMGLYEEPVLRWLKPSEWDACGYIYEEKNQLANISRDPLRRFEDMPDDFISTIIKVLENDEDVCKSIIDVVRGITIRHSTVKQGDIAVIFLDKESYIYDLIPKLKAEINRLFDWDVNVSFETKISDPDRFFISNINNAKGLEFPFVICFSRRLSKAPTFRNALYTMMARSFLESHLILGSKVDLELVNRISNGLSFMQKHNYMSVRVPTKEEIENQQDLFVLEEAESIESYIRSFCNEKEASPRLVAKLVSRITSIIGDGDFDEDYLANLLELEYERHKKL
ncbi:MAG: ATP-binding domain-containing protein [Moraxellaceae bacterium]|nr:ATP-binding domain-containing protein [Moraxellaceae bacterium]